MTPEDVRRRSRAGMAILEIIAALVVLTIGLFGAVHLYLFGMDRMRTMGEIDQAMRAVNNEMEHLRALSWDELPARNGAAFVHAERDLIDLSNAVSSVTVRDDPSIPGLLREATVTVTWTAEHGRTITKSATTLLSARAVS